MDAGRKDQEEGKIRERESNNKTEEELCPFKFI